MGPSRATEWAQAWLIASVKDGVELEKPLFDDVSEKDLEIA
jgi:hypothetical protein